MLKHLIANPILYHKRSKSGGSTYISRLNIKSLRLQALVINIIPDNTELENQLYGISKAMGFIEPSRSVLLLYDTFPYQIFGSYAGIVENISRSAISSRLCQSGAGRQALYDH